MRENGLKNALVVFLMCTQNRYDPWKGYLELNLFSKKRFLRTFSFFFCRIVTVGPVEDCQSLSSLQLGEFVILINSILKYIQVNVLLTNGNNTSRQGLISLTSYLFQFIVLFLFWGSWFVEREMIEYINFLSY